MKIKVVGTIFGSSGYDIHTRNLINEFKNYKDLDIQLETNLPQNWMQLCSDYELEIIKKNIRGEDYDYLLLITLATQGQMYLCENKPIIHFYVWEGSNIPLSHLKYLENDLIKQIWVPSNHTKKAIENTTKNKKLLDKIKLVPHGVNSEIFYPNKKEENKKFTFFYDKGLRNIEDRGGAQYLLKAYLEEFTKDDDVELILKINPAYGIPNLDSIIRELKIKNKNLPSLKINVEKLPYEDLNILYNKVDIFVAPTRCEGFGLGILQALSCGLPVITTNYGGQTDFVPNDNKCGYYISGVKEKVNWDLMYEGSEWLTPNINELRKLMRKVFNDYKNISEDKKNKIINKCRNIAKKYSWLNSSKNAYKCLKSI